MSYEITPTEYLVQERAAEYKHEFYKGRVTAMSGASMAHNDILVNLIAEMRNNLKGKPCKVLPGDMRVTVPSGEAYMYPDALIVCGEPELMDDRFDTLKNPVVIFEILSPSTEAHDRGKKFHFYRQIPSFKEYVLIDSTQIFVEISHRQADDSWKFDASLDPDGHLRMESIQSLLSLAEIYRNVF
ncbi:Uma2 family endonuclease [Puia sp.]|jgi:Uma2 family endonuclease|uniref:Uma2 family endonuclease n=1 Tax=Puia sp. TaxID=2045100 RepID=UPI002F400490